MSRGKSSQVYGVVTWYDRLHEGDAMFEIVTAFAIPAGAVLYDLGYVTPRTRDKFSGCSIECKHKPACPYHVEDVKDHFTAWQFAEKECKTYHGSNPIILNFVKSCRDHEPKPPKYRRVFGLEWERRLEDADICHSMCKHKFDCRKVKRIKPFIPPPGPPGYLLAYVNYQTRECVYRSPDNRHDQHMDMVPNPAFDEVAWRDTYQDDDKKKADPPKKPPAQILKEKREAEASSSRDEIASSV